MASAFLAALLTLAVVGHGPAAMVGQGPAARFCDAAEVSALHAASLGSQRCAADTWQSPDESTWQAVDETSGQATTADCDDRSQAIAQNAATLLSDDASAVPSSASAGKSHRQQVSSYDESWWHAVALGTIAAVVCGGMIAWKAKNRKQHRAAATMQAAARRFLARLLFRAMYVSLALRAIERVARGMLARRRAAHWRRFRTEFIRTIPRRAAFTIQAAARGYLARRAMRRRDQLTTSTSGVSHGVSATNQTRDAAADHTFDGPTMAPEEKGSNGPTTPCTVKAKKSRKRGGVRTSGAKKAAAAGMPSAPYSVPGVINFKMPDTPCGCGARLAMRLFPYMLPMADFPEAKCNVLREVVVARMDRIGWAQPGFLAVIEAAVHAEDLVKQAHPERHPGGDATALVRFLGDYLKQVEHAEALVAARADVYTDFARVIHDHRAVCEASKARRREEKIVEQGWNAQSGSDTDSDPGDEDPHRLTDSQLINICRKGDPTLLSLLSISDRVRAEHLLEEAKTDDAATKSAAHVAAGGAQA